MRTISAGDIHPSDSGTFLAPFFPDPFTLMVFSLKAKLQI